MSTIIRFCVWLFFLFSSVMWFCRVSIITRVMFSLTVSAKASICRSCPMNFSPTSRAFISIRSLSGSRAIEPSLMASAMCFSSAYAGISDA